MHVNVSTLPPLEQEIKNLGQLLLAYTMYTELQGSYYMLLLSTAKRGCGSSVFNYITCCTLNKKIIERTMQIHAQGAAKEIPCPMKEFS